MIKFCHSAFTSAQQPTRALKALLAFLPWRRFNANCKAWSHSQCRPKRDAQVRLLTRKGNYSFSLKLKKISGRMFGKIIVPVFHLDTFASKMTANTVSYFMFTLEQLGTSDID